MFGDPLVIVSGDDDCALSPAWASVLPPNERAAYRALARAIRGEFEDDHLSTIAHHAGLSKSALWKAIEALAARTPSFCSVSID